MNKVETKIKAEVKNTNEIKLNLKSQTKKRSATEFFTELFTQKKNLGQFLGGLQASQPIDSVNNSTSTIPTQENPVKISPNENKQTSIDPMIADWLTISSPIFKNSKKFPPVTLYDGRKLVIRSDSLDFRINDVYRENSIKDDNSPPSDKYFWFRLSGTHIYYSSTISDLNILGAISVRFITIVQNIKLTTDEGHSCFIVDDTDNQQWKICAAKEEIRNKWVCRLQETLRIPLDPACNGYKHDDYNNKTIIQPIIIIPIPSPHCNEDWNYQENGRDWNCDCSEGREQSPIDLPPIEKAIDSPIKPLFQYNEIPVKSLTSKKDGQVKETENLKIEVFKNTLKIVHDKFGRVVTIDGAIYYAQEIVIHTPAEHTIDGKKYDMEVQIIHYGQTKGDIAKQVMLCFLFEKKAGIYNRFIDDLDIFNLPNPISKETDLVNNVFIPKILYSSDDEEVPHMKPFSFYTYQGSIPFPPCTEKTIVYVASKPMPIGTTALQLFQEAIRIPDIIDEKGNVIVSNWIPMNNREIQSTNRRPVFHYSHEKYCGPDPVKITEPQGHYEKIKNSSTKYFYVSDMLPSGIPGALVVSENEALGNDILKIR
jgi:carbonic anhydrase